MNRTGIAGFALILAVAAGACTSRGAVPAYTAPVVEAPPVQAVAPPVVAPPPEADAPVGIDIRGGGAPGLKTVVEDVNIEPADGGAQIRITFRDGVPVWSAHTAVHGQQLFLELGAPLAATTLTPSGRGADIPVHVTGGPFGALVTATATPDRIRYAAEAGGRTLTVTVGRGGRAPLEGAPHASPGMERADSAVAAFLQARVGSSQWPAQPLSDLARLQYQHLYGTVPPVVRAYRDWRQSGQWPGDAAIHMVRVEGDGWFADEMLYVTAINGEPQIALVLGHPPVAVPPGADGQAALRMAEAFLAAESGRDRTAMWAALSLSAQQRLGSIQSVGVGVSNPHPFRFEIQGLRQAGPDCWRLDVLRSQEYTGEGELGWGVGPLFVTKESGRFGALWNQSCGQ